MVRQKIYQMNCSAQKILILRVVIGRDVVQIVLRFLIFVFTSFIAVASYSTEEPQAQFRQEILIALHCERIFILVGIVDVFWEYALSAQQSVFAVHFRKEEFREDEYWSFVFLIRYEEVADVLDTPSIFLVFYGDGISAFGILISQILGNQFLRVAIVLKKDQHRCGFEQNYLVGEILTGAVEPESLDSNLSFLVMKPSRS